MLFELLEYLTTPCPPVARRMGYLREAVAIRARYARHRAAWQPHLAASREVIRRAVARCASRRRAVVLGSGLLLDVPLEELAAAFEEVELVDLVHLRPARRRAAKFANVVLRETDITGVAVALERGEREKRTGLPPPAPPAIGDADLIVSANVLSQLPVVPTAYLARRRRHAEGEVTAFARRLVESHLEWLNGQKGVVVLLTDIARAYVEGEDRVVQKYDVLYGVRLPPADHEWDWTVGPVGEVTSRFALRNRVAAYLDFRAASARSD